MIVCVRMYACVITVADSLGVLRGRFSSSKPFQNECFSVMKTYNLGKYNPIQSNPPNIKPHAKFVYVDDPG